MAVDYSSYVYRVDYWRDDTPAGRLVTAFMDACIIAMLKELPTTDCALRGIRAFTALREWEEPGNRDFLCHLSGCEDESSCREAYLESVREGKPGWHAARRYFSWCDSVDGFDYWRAIDGDDGKAMAVLARRTEAPVFTRAMVSPAVAAYMREINLLPPGKDAYEGPYVPGFSKLRRLIKRPSENFSNPCH